MKRIGRIVICYPKKYGINDCHKENGKDYIFNEKALCNAFASDFKDNKPVEYLVTPAGLLRFDFPQKYQDHNLEEVNNNYLNVLHDLVKEAESKVQSFIACINKTQPNIFNYTNFLVIGIDGKNNKHLKNKWC